MRARTVLRLGAEVAFISLVAVIAHMADLSTAGIIVIMAVAWLLTAIAEGLVARGWHGVATFVPPVRPFSGGFQHRESAPAWESMAAPPEEIAPAWLESAEVLGVHVAGFEPVVQGEAEPVGTEAGPAAAKAERQAEALRTVRSSPSRRTKPRPAPSAAEPEEEPEELGVTIEPEDGAVAGAAEVMAATEVTETPEESGEAAPDETGVQPGANLWPPAEAPWPRRRSPGDGAEVSLGQRPEPDPQLQPERETEAAALSSSAQGWNVWELERLARRLGEAGTASKDEWAFLLVYLREFADQNGVLPADLDALVRESFPELVAVAETT